MTNSVVECKTAVRDNKRRLVYHNKRTNKILPIVVGKRGGLSIKSPKSKTRRYIKKNCTKNSSKSFWDAVKNKQKKQK
jgi:hypothetical protein